MGYRRGFKTEANDIAREIRRELGLSSLDPLDPSALAKLLDIEIIPLSDYVGAAPGVAHLLKVEPEVFSAVTVFRGKERTIVHNDAHTPGRQNSNQTHELSHGLLHHPPTPALDNRGCRYWNQDIEDEAQWLAGAILITEDAALTIVRRRLSNSEAAALLNVSEQMIQFRLNVTGAWARIERARRARA